MWRAKYATPLATGECGEGAGGGLPYRVWGGSLFCFETIFGYFFGGGGSFSFTIKCSQTYLSSFMFVSNDSSVKYTALSSHDAETWVATTLYYLHADTIWTSQYICCLILISYIYLIFSTLFSFKFQYISFILEAPAQIPCMPLDPPAQTLVCHWNPLHRPWVCHWNPLHRQLEPPA